ncbi:MAG: K(+)-transporting ATPase subunit C [Candidatus Aminicenantes bacterium]|nr:K(+)-transporting ATPase subunit C [Candidatus Aminicenantes bacterium]
MKIWLSELRHSVAAVLSLAVISCGIYPAAVWILAQGLFPAKANGSLVMRSGAILGSRLIGQGFAESKYFHPRPSAAGQGYDASSSGGRNLGPTSKKLVDAVRQCIADYRAENNLSPDTIVPADAVTASASGLDPHISLKNALLQTPRVARVRGLDEKAVRKLVETYTEGRDLGILGEPRVNVLMLNLALDGTLK